MTAQSPTAAQGKNIQIWDNIYKSGSTLWYPAEALVRLVRRHESQEGFSGMILDHGCGTGNVSEFLSRSGHNVHCTEVSAEALTVVRQRYAKAGLPAPEVTLINPELDLPPQLPRYNHVIAWQSLCYGPRPSTISNLAQLVAGLPSGGCIIVCFPTPKDLLYRYSQPLNDGSRQFVQVNSGQLGAVLTIPESEEELRSWCKGIEVRDVVEYGMRFSGEQNQFYALYGVKE